MKLLYIGSEMIFELSNAVALGSHSILKLESGVMVYITCRLERHVLVDLGGGSIHIQLSRSWNFNRTIKFQNNIEIPTGAMLHITGQVTI